MAHLNLYLPDDIAAGLKRDAAAAGNVPLSRYVLSLLTERSSADGLPPQYFSEACGFLREDMEVPLDVAPEAVEPLDVEP